jgi:hypothetical protein
VREREGEREKEQDRHIEKTETVDIVRRIEYF